MRIAGLLLLLAPLAVGQQVEGLVVNAVTGEPVPRASVVLRRSQSNRVGPSQSYGAMTDAGGRFVIQAEPAGYRLAVRRAGFVDAEYGARGARRAGKVISLAAGQQLKDLDVRLTPTAAVSGRVVDENGDPVTYALVSLLRFHYRDGRKQLVSEAGETTNDLGEYRVFWLRPGRYYVSAAHRSARPVEPGDGTGEAYLPTYYPGTADVAAAGVIEVQPGAQLRGIDFTLFKARAARVRGRVAVPSEVTRGNVRVMLQPRGLGSAHNHYDTSANRQGAFEFRAVTPGTYTLLAVVHDGDRSLSTRQPVDVGGANVDNLNVVITPGLGVTGQVREEGTEQPNFAGVRVVLRQSLGPVSSGAVKENGDFSIAHVAPDVYTLRVFPLRDGYWIKSVRLGEEDALENGLDLTRGALPLVSVIIAPNAGQVDGIVTDGKGQPVFDATVALVPAPPRRRRDELYGVTTTGQDGRFTLRNIAPGDYKLFAWDDVEYGAWLDPDFLKPLESEGRTVILREGSRENVELSTPIR